MLEQMKERVWRANLQLKESGLVVLTWGNVSEIDRDKGIVAISGMTAPESMANDPRLQQVVALAKSL